MTDRRAADGASVAELSARSERDRDTEEKGTADRQTRREGRLKRRRRGVFPGGAEAAAAATGREPERTYRAAKVRRGRGWDTLTEFEICTNLEEVSIT